MTDKTNANAKTTAKTDAKVEDAKVVDAQIEEVETPEVDEHWSAWKWTWVTTTIIAGTVIVGYAVYKGYQYIMTDDGKVLPHTPSVDALPTPEGRPVAEFVEVTEHTQQF